MTTTLVVLTQEQLVQLVREAVRAELAAAGWAAEHWLDQTAAAALLGVKSSSVPTLCQRDGLPHSRVGRLVRFRRAEIETWLEARHSRKSDRRLTAEEIEKIP